MTTRDNRKVESALRRKGFKADESHHHRFVYHAADGRPTAVRMHTSHSRRQKTLGDTLLNQMARQCRLSKADFLRLVDCELTHDAYEVMILGDREFPKHGRGAIDGDEPAALHRVADSESGGAEQSA